MNIMGKLTWRGMWKNKTRTLVTIVGILLSAAMFMAVTTLGYSLRDYLIRMEIQNSGDYFLRFDYTSREHMDTVARDERVLEMGALGILGYATLPEKPEQTDLEPQTFAVAAGDEAFFRQVSVPLREGRLPQKAGEVVISTNAWFLLRAGGLPCDLGDTIRLDVTPEYRESSIDLPAEGAGFTKTYTIVGISGTDLRLDDWDLRLSHLLTVAEEGDSPLWYRLFVKTHKPRDAHALAEIRPDGVAGYTNSSLLNLYGATRYNNFNTVIVRICATLAAIIMVGSVSLIYNAFSISVSERTRQFGLLSSVGATRRQIRRSVLSEAVYLSAIGIPLGLLSGYAGIAITLRLLSDRIHSLLTSEGGTVLLEPKLSGLALGAAAGIALVTVLVSAAIPAGRATRIGPMDAIRQKQDYQVPGKGVRVSRVTYRLFGLPGVLSRKYYKISRRRYRTTVISLVISIILFLSAASISQVIQKTVDQNVAPENYDMLCMGQESQLDTIRRQDFVAESASVMELYRLACAPDSLLSDSYLDFRTALQAYQESGIPSRNLQAVRLIYLEDEIFRRYLGEQNLPEEAYFQGDIPTALVVTKQAMFYNFDSDTGATDRITYTYVPYDQEGCALPILRDRIPPELRPFQTQDTGDRDSWSYRYDATQEGDPILRIAPCVAVPELGLVEDWDNQVEYLLRMEPTPEGYTLVHYHRRDPITGVVSDTAEVTEQTDLPSIRIGATITELPFGVSHNAVDNYYQNSLILPMSALPAGQEGEAELCIRVSDYAAAKACLESTLGEENYVDFRASQEDSRTLVLLVRVFSYGFIILISLISVANVFNTISTNVALRRRDFGMLRSVGFRERDLLNMMNYECLTYGCKSLLWGLPMGLILSYLIQSADAPITVDEFRLPWSALLVSALCVFFVVFTTMFYALAKMRRDNPMDAIRMETT